MYRATLKSQYCSSQKQRCGFRFANFFLFCGSVHARAMMCQQQQLYSLALVAEGLCCSLFFFESASSLTITA